LRLKSLGLLIVFLSLSQLAMGQAAYKFFSWQYSPVGLQAVQAVGLGINGSGAIVGTITPVGQPAAPVQGFYRSPQGVFSIVSFPPSLLGEPSGTVVSTYLLGINYQNEMIGTVADSLTGNLHAFILSAPGGQFTIIDPPGQTTTLGLGLWVKNTGETLGTGNAGLSTDFYIRSPTGSYQFIACPTIPSSTQYPLAFTSINDHGNSVGTYYNPTTLMPHVFTRTAGGHCALFTDPTGAVATVAHAINDYGVVVGSYLDSSNNTHGFVWDPTLGFQTVDNGSTGTTLFSIDNEGVVLGQMGSGVTFYAAPLSTASLGGPSLTNFGSVPVGQTGAPVPIKFTNPGSEAIVLGVPTIPAPTGAVNGTFTIVSNGCPVILTAGQSCSLTVKMTASAAGSISNVLHLDSTATNAPSQVQLSGTGS